MQAAYRRMMRFRAGWPPGRPLPCAAVRGCGKLSFITHNRTTVEPTLELSIVRSTRRYSRHDNGCLPPGECAHDAARQARGGLGAFWPAHSALRCEATAQAASHRAMRLRAGLSAGPYLAGMQGRVPRGSPHSERPRLCLPACLYSSLRCEAAAQAAYRRARRLLPITRCDGRTAAHRQPTAA